MAGLLSEAVAIRVGLQASLAGDLTLPPGRDGIVLFAHGSGSSHLSPRNRFVAEVLHESGLGTLLFDLLTPEEEEAERYTRHLRFDIGLLAERLVAATLWLDARETTAYHPIGYFGASTGGAAALVAAARLGNRVGAVVSRGGRPDLAGQEVLHQITVPTLLIVGGEDEPVISLNRLACDALAGEKQLEIVPGASHLFEEPGTLEIVASLAGRWFRRHLGLNRQPASDQSLARG